MAVIKDIDITNYETKTEEVEITDPTGSYSLGSIISGVKQRDVFLGTGFSIVKGATVYVEGRDFSLSQTNEDSELTERYGVALYSSFKSYKLSGTVTVTYRQVATYVVSALPIALEERMSTAEGDIDTLTSDIAAHENNTEIHVTLAWKLAMEAKSAVHSVADITAMSALSDVNNGDICRVADAGDGKFAAYLRIDGSWTVLSDADWENLSLAWSALTNIPPNISALASAPNISTASVGQVPAKSASGGIEWVTPSAAAGVGDVVSDVSASVAGNIVVMSGAEGKHVTDSGIPVMDARAVAYLSELFQGSIDNPYDIVTDGTYLYYLAHGATARVYKMSIATKVVTELTAVANARTLCLYNGVLYIFYFTDTDLGYTTYNVTTDALAFVPVTGTQPKFISGVVCDGTYLYVVAGSTYNSIIRINMSTHVGELWDYVSSSTSFNSIARDALFMYVVDEQDRLIRIRLSDKSHTIWTTLPASASYSLRCPVVDGTYGYVILQGLSGGAAGVVYKVSTSDGTIVDTWAVGGNGAYGLCKNDTEFYFTELYGNKINRIYQSTQFICPSNIISQSISSSNITMTEDRFGNILLSGALLANRELVLPSTVRAYRIINTCTGVYYVTIKTASGTGYNSYPNDVLELFCDGTNIRLTGWNENLPTGVERLTPGYWRGCQLFKKIVDFGQLPASTSKSVAHGISSPFSLKSKYGEAKALSGIGLTIPSAVYASLENIQLYNDNTYLYVVTGSDKSGYTSTFITLEYIKA